LIATQYMCINWFTSASMATNKVHISAQEQFYVGDSYAPLLTMTCSRLSRIETSDNDDQVVLNCNCV